MTKQEFKKLNEERMRYYTGIGYEFVNPNTAKADGIRASYRRNCGYYLHEVYGRYSHAKLYAWRKWERKMRDDLDGVGMHITSYNTCSFCLGFDFDDPMTGELMYAHITPAHNYVTCADPDPVE